MRIVDPRAFFFDTDFVRRARQVHRIINNINRDYVYIEKYIYIIILNYYDKNNIKIYIILITIKKD